MQGLGGFNLLDLSESGIYCQCETLNSLTCFSNFQDNAFMEGNFTIPPLDRDRYRY